MILIERIIIQFKQKWGVRIFFSLVDQGVFSLSNFLVTFFLGRWLSEIDYGVFSIVFVVFLFLSGFYNAFVFEPMMVFAPGFSDENVITYLTNLFHIVIKSILLTIPLCGLFILLGFFFDIDTMLVVSMSTMILTMPITMSFWLARQACYIQLKPSQAIAGDFIYALVLLGSILLAVMYGLLSTFYIFIVMGFASLFGVVPIIINLGINPKHIITQLNWFSIDIELRHQWNYSKWALATSITYGASTLAFIPLVGIILGLEQAGLYRALQNLVAPLQQIITAFIALLLPWTSRQRVDYGDKILRKRVFGYVALLLLISILYLLPINIFGKDLLKFYKKEYYNGFLWAIPVFSGIMLLTSITNSFWIGFRVLEKPKSILISKVFSVIFIFTVCIFLAIFFQFVGLMAGVLMSILLELIILLYQWKKVPFES